MIMAYLHQNSYYDVLHPEYEEGKLLTEMEKFKLDYYLCFYQTTQEKQRFLLGEIARAASNIQEVEPGLLLLKLTP